MRKFIQWMANFFPSITVFLDNQVKYLTRYYVFGKDRKLGNIFIHQFHSSDELGELHSHPWSWSVGLILVGGYVEERRMKDDSVKSFRRRPFTFNFITKNDFHRVDLIDDDCWTLFIAGPRTKSWGFWDRNTKVFRDWTTNPNSIA